MGRGTGTSGVPVAQPVDTANRMITVRVRVDLGEPANSKIGSVVICPLVRLIKSLDTQKSVT